MWIDDYKKHAIESYPNECVGVLTPDFTYVRCINRSKTPTLSWSLKGEDYITNNAIAVLHSHPYSPDIAPQYNPSWPSSHDMETMCHTPSIDHYIISTDGQTTGDMVCYSDKNRQPLFGRTWIHGIQDCWSLIRDYYYLEKNIKLIDVPRSYEWWINGKDLYSENIHKAGFIDTYTDKTIRVGDLLMMKVNSPVINHAAIYCGDNKILHHKINRLSGYDDYSRWKKFAVTTMRYTGKNICVT